MSFSKQQDVLKMPNLIEVQRDSYNWFIKEGLREVLDDISPITSNYSDDISLELVDYSIPTEEEARATVKNWNSIEDCKKKEASYTVPLKVKVRLKNKDVMTEQEMFFGDFPLMTKTGTFIINGAERVVVSQLVRSPGVYFSATKEEKSGESLFASQVIPTRGSWLEYENDVNKVMYVKVDRERKLNMCAFIRALGFGTDEEIKAVFGDDPMINATIEKDPTKNVEEGLLELYKRLRPDELPSAEQSKQLMTGMFFDPKRYDLARVGRYKYNKKLHLKNRVVGRVLLDDVIDALTGEVVAEAGTTITTEVAIAIQNAGVPYIDVESEEKQGDKIVKVRVRVITNQMVDIAAYLPNLDKKKCNIFENVYYPVLIELLNEYQNPDEIEAQVKKNYTKLIPKHITKEDILASINYLINLSHGIGTIDDIDHLGNRRIRAVGELLQNQFRIGLTRMERVVRDKMQTQDQDSITPGSLINIKPVNSAIREFFGSSQLSQFMDQNNPLSELTHKRRFSALGPGGLSRERAGFEVRDVHYTHYGRMCPIETPEGPNIGLINSLASFSRINTYGFIEAPYRVVDKSDPENPVVTNEVRYMTADEEDSYYVAQANEPIDESGHFVNETVSGRHIEEIARFPKEKIDLMDVSPKMVFSVATAMIPFLQNDDANRALMGSNMQRQAVPLMVTEAPAVGTGMEHMAAKDSGVCVIAEEDGVVKSATYKEIVITNNNGEDKTYSLIKFGRSNQGTCINQHPIVTNGDVIKAGDVIADGPSTANGEIALGKNPLIGFMTWEGYNYEDAVLLSERLVQNDVYTSIHIEKYETEARTTKLGDEEITREIPGVGDEALKNLDEDGIVRIGAEVRAGDILVGKVTPKGEPEPSPEERLLRAIFGDKSREVRDTSLRVPHGEFGVVVKKDIFVRGKDNAELPQGVNECVRVYIAQKRKIQVGDKMAGRHGNKGVVSRVLPVEDMPYLPNGRPLDIVLNPLGVPSRMNIGQILEIHLSLASKVLGINVETPVFDGANANDVQDTLEMANCYVNEEWSDFLAKYGDKLDESLIKYLEEHRPEAVRDWKGVPIGRDGKVRLRDGRTGEYFDNPVTIGFMHYLKLHHLVDDKIHARATGPYSLITQQPLGGKAQFGGQRFGEMEVWALEAYGAANLLQEIITIKSDDVNGRTKAYEAITKGENIQQLGTPESFRVLVKTLQSLALDITVFDEDGNEVSIDNEIEAGMPSRDNKNVSDSIIETSGYSYSDASSMGYSYVDSNGELEASEENFDSFDSFDSNDGE